jgi:hypothetical protein
MKCSLLRLVVPVLCTCASLVPERADAFAEDVHAEVSRRALAGSGLADKAAPIDLGQSAALRSALDGYARSSAALRTEWARRYPQPTDFDAFAEKQLFLLAAGASVYGIDRTDPSLAKDVTLLEVVARASSHPDQDWRNRDRYAYDSKRQPLKDPSGQPVAADPALLNFGTLGTLSSQAHAHYGLAQVEQTDDTAVLKTDPRRFAMRVGYDRAPVITLAAEMAQLHLDLALLAALQSGTSGRELSWQFLGEGFHYLQDVGNQAHTVQVGIYDFFFDAFLERIKLGLLTGGGYFGKMRSLGSIGVDILGSHHVLAEELTRKRMLGAKAGDGNPVGQMLLQAATTDDPEFAARLDTALSRLGPAPEKGEFALVITRELIEVSSHEGEALYRATREIADPRLRTYKLVFDDQKDDPDNFVVPRTARTEAAYKEFWSLEERAIRRVGTAQRRVVALLRKALDGAPTPEAKTALQQLVMQRLLERQLKMLGEADARLADYLKNPPVKITAPERSVGLLVADLAALGLVLVVGLLVVRRLRRRA